MVVNVYATSATLQNCSRNELLAFVSNYTHSNLTRVEELSSGAEYCQLTDVLFPGSVQLKKVKWHSKKDIHWISNWRILQNAWEMIGIRKVVPVERLVKAKFQENFEFLQWFKRFFDANYARNTRKNVAFEYPATILSADKQRRSAGIAQNNFKTSTMRLVKSRKVAPQVTTKEQHKADQPDDDYQRTIAELIRERDCYWRKLQKIGNYCMNFDNISSKQILDILHQEMGSLAMNRSIHSNDVQLDK